MCALIIYSVVFPSRAADMWHNFGLIPEWVQYLFVGMMSVTWGLPITKEYVGQMAGAIGRGIESRREYKLEKARINRDAVFKSLKAKIFLKGMTQAQVDSINAALDQGEQ